MGLQLQRLPFSNQLLFKLVVLQTSDAVYHFREKNGRGFQNGWVAPAPHQLLFKKVVLVSLCVLVLMSDRNLSECRVIMGDTIRMAG